MTARFHNEAKYCKTVGYLCVISSLHVLVGIASELPFGSRFLLGIARNCPELPRELPWVWSSRARGAILRALASIGFLMTECERSACMHEIFAGCFKGHETTPNTCANRLRHSVAQKSGMCKIALACELVKS